MPSNVFEFVGTGHAFIDPLYKVVSTFAGSVCTLVVKGTPSDPIYFTLLAFFHAARAMGRVFLSWHGRSHAAAGGTSLLR